jgi:metal-sulfur cluster biosynthetic enzyme
MIDGLDRERWPQARRRVEIVWDRPWDKERMSEAARNQLGG